MYGQKKSARRRFYKTFRSYHQLRTEDCDGLEDDGLQWLVAMISADAGDFLDHIETVDNFSEDGVSVIEVRCGDFGDEEL